MLIRFSKKLFTCNQIWIDNSTQTYEPNPENLIINSRTRFSRVNLKKIIQPLHYTNEQLDTVVDDKEDNEINNLKLKENSNSILHLSIK